MLKGEKFVKKFQKPVYIAAFVVTVVTFVYALGFSTDLYPLYQFSDQNDILLAVKNADVYALAQPFNRLLFSLSVYFILLSIPLFVFFCQKRRLFYLSNYITSIAYVVASVGLAIYMLINIFILRAAYLQVDFETYKTKAERFSARYVKSTFTFDFGILLCLFLLVLSAAIIYILVYKYRLKKSEQSQQQ